MIEELLAQVRMLEREQDARRGARIAAAGKKPGATTARRPMRAGWGLWQRLTA